MSYESKVYRVLIATPSDVDEEREIIARIIQSWNDLNSYTKKVVLLPLRWETHIAPDFGERPQEVINKAIVDECDLLIGCFWTRIGSPTGKEESGTLEEIKRVSESGKPIMLYFSKRGQDPSLIDLDQLKKLKEFKQEVKQKALIEEYTNSIDFRDKLSRQLEIKIREIQKNAKDTKISTIMSFISLDNGNLLPKDYVMNVSLPEVDKKEIEKIVNSKDIYKQNKSEINKELSKQIEKHSTIPIILGIENKSKFNLNNFLVEVRIKRDDKLYKLSAEDKKLRTPFYYTINNSNKVSDDVWRKLSNLDNDGVLKSSDENYSFSFSDISIQKDRIKVIRPYLFIRPSNSCKVEIQIKLYAENLLEPQVETCTIEIDTVRSKKSFFDFIPDIDQLIDDEIPF